MISTLIATFLFVLPNISAKKDIQNDKNLIINEKERSETKKHVNSQNDNDKVSDEDSIRDDKNHEDDENTSKDEKKIDESNKQESINTPK